MKKLLPLFFIILTSCTAAQTVPVVPEAPVPPKEKAPDLTKMVKNCICPKMWMPVCGENQKTYGNSCEADCAGVKYTMGECQATK